MKTLRKAWLLTGLIFIRRGVHVNRGQGIRKIKALKDCLNAGKYINSHIFLKNEIELDREASTESKRTQRTQHNEQNVADYLRNKNKQQDSPQGTVHTNREDKLVYNLSEENSPANNERPKNYYLGTTGLVKAYQGRNKFGGQSHENLESTISVYNKINKS